MNRDHSHIDGARLGIAVHGIDTNPVIYDQFGNTVCDIARAAVILDCEFTDGQRIIKYRVIGKHNILC